MYSINGKYPHNDELVNGYYTGYTVDQAKTADNDVVVSISFRMQDIQMIYQQLSLIQIAQQQIKHLMYQ